MRINKNRKSRRYWVLLNLAALSFSVAVFELLKEVSSIDKTILWIFLAVLLLLFIASFILAFGVTGVWRLTHAKFANLDERQMMIISNAIRISYTVFTVLVILVIYLYAMLEKGPIDVVMAASMLYLAHILPGAILAWHEKII